MGVQILGLQALLRLGSQDLGVIRQIRESEVGATQSAIDPPALETPELAVALVLVVAAEMVVVLAMVAAAMAVAAALLVVVVAVPPAVGRTCGRRGQE